LRLARYAGINVASGWVLSPAYDLNPSPDNPGRLSTAIDLDDTTASIDTALSVSGCFRLSLAEARTKRLRSGRSWVACGAARA
jgi:serine/threonine-protein kinase HipA